MGNLIPFQLNCIIIKIQKNFYKSNIRGLMIKIILGKKIRSLRKSVNLTQDELGKILGHSGKVISNWENGCTEPKIDPIKAMVKFFDISYTEFFEDI